MWSNTLKKCFIVFTLAIQRFQTLRAMCTEVWNKHRVFKKNDFHWLFTTIFYQQIENSERANQIHRSTKDHCKFILRAVRRQTSSDHPPSPTPFAAKRVGGGAVLQYNRTQLVHTCLNAMSKNWDKKVKTRRILLWQSWCTTGTLVRRTKTQRDHSILIFYSEHLK